MVTPAELQRLRALCAEWNARARDDDEEERDCVSCHSTMMFDADRPDPTPLCDYCAQEVTPALLAEVERLRAVADRVTTIADETFGLAPVESPEESLTRIEHGISLAAQEVEHLRTVAHVAAAVVRRGGCNPGRRARWRGGEEGMSYARIEGLLRSHAAKKITLAEVSELIHLLAAERTEEARVYSITRDEDAARMRELDALVAEPLTVERLESVYMAVTASPSLDKPPVGVLRLRGLTAVALAIFAAQRTERAVEAANAEWQREYPEDEHAGMLRTIAANQRAAVDGFGESDKNPGRRALRCVRALAERDAERAVNEADARRWREAVEGVGDVERYARILWDAEQIDHSYDSWDACATEYIHLARAIIAAFRALALSDGAIEAASRGGDTWVDARCIRAALDYACSDVGAG